MLDGNASLANTVITTVQHVTLQRGMLMIDRGARVTAGNVDPEERQLLVKIILFTYRWNRNRWEFVSHEGTGHRKLPSGGLGGTPIKTSAMHPDIRDLAQEFMPAWKPVE
jgi:hypothetical protein